MPVRSRVLLRGGSRRRVTSRPFYAAIGVRLAEERDILGLRDGYRRTWQRYWGHRSPASAIRLWDNG